VTCPNCSGTGVKLNPRVYAEWGNRNSGCLPLTTECECSLTQPMSEGRDDEASADTLHGSSADLLPPQRKRLGDF
jgi:hypothetical protein